MFDRKIFFDHVREKPFGGSLTQQQVDGMNDLMDAAEKYATSPDLRFYSYMLATTMHETASTMCPIEEYGKGSGQPYGKRDPETGQTYYGRGYVQLTWRDNYAKATAQLGLTGADDLEWHASRALDHEIAARVMGRGMREGWFRPPNCLGTYFNEDRDDPYNAREIINGDKTYKPSWANGQSIGNIIAGYHRDFLAALQAAWLEPAPSPEPDPEPDGATLSPKGFQASLKAAGYYPGEVDGLSGPQTRGAVDQWFADGELLEIED